MIKKDGGPASVMSLRDLFAGMVCQGWLSTFDAKQTGMTLEQIKLFVHFNYAIADAMIEEREKAYDPNRI